MSHMDKMAKYGFCPFDHEKPQWFDVRLRPIYDERGLAIPGHLRVEREDTGDTLAVHTEKYKLIPYATAFEAFDRAIATSGLNVQGMQVANDMADNGAKVFRQYVLPAYTETVSKTEVALRICMLNSYDGSCSFRGNTGFYDFACANQAMIGRHIVDVRVRHTGRAEIEPVIESIVGAAKAHLQNVERLRRWSKIELTPYQAKLLLEKMPQATKPLVDRFTADFAMIESQTMWDLHCLMTSWATHEDGKRGNAANRARTSFDRSKRILDLVEGDEWRRVELAA